MNLWTIIAVALTIYTIRMLGPEDLADGYHQERAAAYVMDVLRNNDWICQDGYYGEVTSKPPMLTWLAALASLPFEQANWFSLALPGALATIALAAMIFSAGSRCFGRMTGFLGALVYLLSPIGAKQMVLVRIDGLFSFTVALAALLALRAWQTGRGWTWFWLAGAVATLTKGPLGVLLAGTGLLAAFWERRTGFSAPIKGSHRLGIVLYLAICGGWFALAYAHMGEPLIDVMLGRELVGQMVESSQGPGPFLQFYLPTAYVLSRFAPWSLLACMGLWRAFKRPSSQAEPRQTERFLTCWFLGGLLIFSSAAHQRPDLIFPLIPPAALLAGRVLAGWMEHRANLARRLIPATTAVALIAISFAYIYAREDHVRVQRTQAVKRLAATVRSVSRRQFPLTHVESPFALQFYLNTKKQPVEAIVGANLLAEEPDIFIATSEYENIRKALGTNQNKAHLLFRWHGPNQETLDLVSNHPRLEWTDDMHWVALPCLFRLSKVDDVDSSDDDFTFQTQAPEASVTLRCIVPGGIQVKNLGSGAQKFLEERELWTMNFTGKLQLRVTTLERRSTLQGAESLSTLPLW